MRSSSTLKFYINGSLDGSFSENTNSLIWTKIGIYRDGLQHPFHGLLDEFGIWNDALSAMEVAALYNSGNPISASTNSGYYTSSSNLKGYWQMNEGSGTYITDASGNGNSGFIYGATWSTDSPWGTSSSSYSTIAAARAQGIGTNITVRGIVTTPNYTSFSGMALALQAPTAGISIYSVSYTHLRAHET